MRKALGVALVLLLVLLPLAAQAQQQAMIRWRQPADSAPVDFFTVYAAPVYPVNGVQLFKGKPTPDAEGVYQADVTTPPVGHFVWISASNAAGESGPSNSWQVPEAEQIEVPGAPILIEPITLRIRVEQVTP
jgi:hypothetical protein